MILNKKGQLGGIVAFVGVVIVLILLAPILLKVATSILDTTATQISRVEPSNRSSDAVTFVEGKITGTMDWVVMALVMFNVFLLLISAFLIDVNPAFVVIYILGAFCLIISAPFTIASAEKLYSMATFSDSISYIPMVSLLLNNFTVFLVGVMVVTGIIIFAKTALFNRGGGESASY